MTLTLAAAALFSLVGATCCSRSAARRAIVRDRSRMSATAEIAVTARGRTD
jgi:hypothetical protein